MQINLHSSANGCVSSSHVKWVQGAAHAANDMSQKGSAKLTNWELETRFNDHCVTKYVTINFAAKEII